MIYRNMATDSILIRPNIGFNPINCPYAFSTTAKQTAGLIKNIIKAEI